VKRDKQRWVAAGVVVALVAPIIAFALLSEGFHATKMDLNDAGIWLVNHGRNTIGRLNTQIQTIEVEVNAGTGNFDVLQVDDAVLIAAVEAKALTPVDVALGTVGQPAGVPDSTSVHLGGTSGIIVDPPTGKTWVSPRSSLTSVDIASAAPTLEAGPNAVGVVGNDGTAYVYGAGRGEVHVKGPSSEPTTTSVEAVAKPQITAVGAQMVLLDGETANLVIPGRRTVALSGKGSNPVLQLPGPSNSEVLVATDDALLGVSMTSGEVRTVIRGGTRGAVPPVYLGGCRYAAWAATPHYAQVCDGRDPQAGDIKKMRNGGRLQFRVNRERVALNDYDTGVALLFTEEEPKTIDNWDEALRNDKKDEESPQIEEQKKEVDCATDTQEAELADDEAGTRPGRAVIVPVLDNDQFSKCDVAVVSLPSQLPSEAGTAAVIANGTKIQVSPAVDRTAPITFDYEVNTRSVPKRASVTVSITQGDANGDPKANADHTSVVAGQTVRHDVLVNDSDPDGDALTLVSATAAGGGTVLFQSGGQVAYTAPNGGPGTQTIDYQITDERGASATGVLTVDVSPKDQNLSPSLHNDRLEMVAGREGRINVLENDVDANGDLLKVTSVDVPPGIEVSWEENGQLQVKAAAPGSWTFTYAVTDSELVAKARVRVDAVQAEGNRPPVAVRDDVAARPGVPAFVDLTANDQDPDGDVLAVVGVTAPTGSEISAELLEMHLLRVTAPAGFATAATITYVVSDGTATSTGVVIVRPLNTAAVNQPPIAGPDEVAVRPGAVTAIPVLANDVDPEGERLRLVATSDDLAASDGSVFIESDQLRFVAPPNGPVTARFRYTAVDPAGNQADGEVTVRVQGADQPNRPPAEPQLDARVFAGTEATIPLQLVGLDPDGDVVAIMGVADAPLKGHARAIPAGFTYRADHGASGTDTFSFTLRDARGLESTGHVRLAVLAKPQSNSPPVAVPDRRTVKAGRSVSIPVLANDSDPDGDTLSLLLDGKDAPTTPRKGEVKPDSDGKSLIYQAAEPGDYSFTYAVSDGRGGSSRGVVTIEVVAGEAPNEPPLVRDDSVEPQAPGATVDVDVLANDADPDGNIADAKVEIVSGADAKVLDNRHVQVTLKETSVALVYELTDSGGQKGRAVISIPVFDNRFPQCELQTVEVKAGESVTVDVLSKCTDPAGKKLELVRLLADRGGTSKLEGDKAVFTAAALVQGDAGFSFMVSNGTSTAIGGVVVRVTGQDFAPEFASTNVDIPAGGERTVDLAALVTDLNPEDTHTFENLQGAMPPKLEGRLDGPKLALKAADDAKGTNVTLTVDVKDKTHTVSGTINVRVLKYDRPPPQAVDDTKETFQDKAVEVDVAANDVDPIGKGLKVKVIGQTSGSADVVGDTSIRYTPASGFFGDADITYEVTDASNDPDRNAKATLRVSVIGRPSKPDAPRRTGTPESQQVSLTWGAVMGNGAPVTKYIVRTDDGKQQETTSNSIVFKGLENGRPYRFKVAAINRAVETDEQIDGQFGPDSEAFTPDKLPGTPETPRLKFGDRQIEVTWAAPPNEGTPITNYQVYISGRDQSGPKDLGTELNTTWSGLTNGVSYTFKVRAENDLGFGEWSSITSDPVNSIPAAEPGPVPTVDAQRLDKDKTAGGWVRVTWGSPMGNGDDDFTFELTVSPADTGPISIPNASTRSYEVGGLRNGQSYTFSVTATNKAGEGPPGSSPAAVPAALPATPSGFTATPADTGGAGGAATLAFTAPADNGDSIDRFEASTNGGGSWAALTGGSGAQPGSPVSLTLGGLNNGTDYSVLVHACNAVGCGSPSSPAAVNPFGRPGTPSVNAGVNGTTITWSWGAPNGNGRPIQNYKLWLDGSPLDFGYGTQTSYSRSFGYSEGHTLTVSAVNTGGSESAQGSAGATTVGPPQSVSLSKGPSGYWSDCYTSPCSRLHVQTSGISGPLNVQCQTTHQANGSVGPWGTYYSYTTSSNPSEQCYFGYPGYEVRVVVNGVVSNVIVW